MKENDVVMCITNGIFVVGRFSLGMLLEPRQFRIYRIQVKDKSGRGEPKEEERIELKPLPGIPEICSIPPGALTYSITTDEMNLLPLYKQITTWGKSLQSKASVIQ